MARVRPGYEFKNEVSADLLFDKPGRLAYANSGPETNGSQFFITEVAVPHLNGGYTIFGQCDEASVELVKQIARMSRDPSSDKPFRPVKIIHISDCARHGDGAEAGGGDDREEASGCDDEATGEFQLIPPGFAQAGQPRRLSPHHPDHD